MNDEDFRALQEQAHQVGELVRHPGWEVFVDFVRFGSGAMAVKQHELLNGAARTFDEYQRRIGWLDGAQFVVEANDRLQKMVVEESARREERRLADEEE